MSDETPSPYASPPAGWYDDPELPGQPRWWDGAQWHASQLPVASLGRGFTGVRGVLSGVLVAAGLVALAQTLLSVIGLGLVRNDPDMSVRAGALVMAGSLVQLALLILGTIVWCIWQYRIAAFTPRGSLRRTPRWHPWSWFIPVVSLWFPLQNMRDLWDAHVGRRGRALLGWWWAAWILQNVVTNIWPEMIDDDGYVRSAAWLNGMGLLASLNWLAMAFLAVTIVRRLSAAAREAEKISA